MNAFGDKGLPPAQSDNEVQEGCGLNKSPRERREPTTFISFMVARQCRLCRLSQPDTEVNGKAANRRGCRWCTIHRQRERRQGTKPRKHGSLRLGVIRSARQTKTRTTSCCEFLSNSAILPTARRRLQSQKAHSLQFSLSPRTQSSGYRMFD